MLQWQRSRHLRHHLHMTMAVVEVDMGAETGAGIVTEMEVLAQTGINMVEIVRVRTEDTIPSSFFFVMRKL